MLSINHCLIKIVTKDAANLSNYEAISKLIEKVSELCATTIVDSNYHEFGPSGFSAYAVLQESHVSLHTWPERNLAILDILSCKKFPNGFKPNIKSLIGQFFTLGEAEIKIELVAEM